MDVNETYHWLHGVSKGEGRPADAKANIVWSEETLL